MLTGYQARKQGNVDMELRSAPGLSRAVRMLLVVAGTACVTLVFGVSGAMAANSLSDYTTNFTRFESPDPQASGQWSQRMRTVPDLNGDGKNEILISDYRESFGGFSVAGRVYMQDGATRNLMYFIDSPQIQANSQFGFVPSVIGDLNGDGKADFVAGADAQDTLADGTPCTPPATGPLGSCNQDQGKAWVFSGANGQLLYELNMPEPQGFGRFGIWTGRAGDINGDGLQDIIVGASVADVPAGCGLDPTTGRRLVAASVPAGCHAGEGKAFIFSGKLSDHTAGATGLLRSLKMPTTDEAPTPCGNSGGISCGSFGLPVQGVGDVTGDGVVDQLVGATFFNFDTATNGACANPAAATCYKVQGALYLFNGATGVLIRRTDAPVSQAGGQFGLHDPEPLAPGDVNGDGRADYFSAAYLQSAPSGEPTAGRGWVFSGATGSVLYQVNDPTPTEGGQFGFSMTKTDYNKDGTPDLYVGQAPHHISGPTIDESGGTYVFNGKDGSLLKRLELPASDAQPGGTGNTGSNLGWASVSPGDLNGDGEPDYVAGAPFEDVDPSGSLPFNCQAPTAGCLQNVGREYFFYSNIPPTPAGGGGTSSGLTSTGSTGSTDTTAPGVSSYGVTNTPFVVSGSSTPTFGFAAKHKKGTTFRYTLSEAATVKIVMYQRRLGRRKGIRCVAPRRSLRKAARCTRFTRKGTLTRVSHPGANSVAFSGRVGSKALSPGNYSATITATDAAKNTSGPKTISFTIARS